MIATTEEQIKNLRAAGKILAGVLQDVCGAAKEGINTAELDLIAEHAIKARGAVPSFLNYKPEGAPYPYPAALCVSVNDEVVHGVPNQKRILRKGDVVTLDAGLSYNGYFVDSARTIIVGEEVKESAGGERSLSGATTNDPRAHELINATREALRAAIAAAKVGARTGDIGAAVARVAKNHNFSVVKDLGGHGVGEAVHEKPFIANEGREGEGVPLVEGMVLAIEPMLAEGKGDIILDEDEWTYRMEDGKRAAHFEDTVLITKTGAEVLTVL